MGRGGRSSYPKRRLRLLDLVLLVGVIAPPMAAVGTVLRARVGPEVRAAVAVVSLAAPMLVGLLVLLAEPGAFRTRWGEGPASVLYVTLTLLAIVAVLGLYFLHPGAALLVGAGMLGLLAYLLTWL